jgi:hypothetical protein
MTQMTADERAESAWFATFGVEKACEENKKLRDIIEGGRRDAGREGKEIAIQAFIS